MKQKGWSEMEVSVMGSKRLTPARVGKMASKCLLLLLLFWKNIQIVIQNNKGCKSKYQKKYKNKQTTIKN